MGYDVTKHQSIAKPQRSCFTKSRVNLRIYLCFLFVCFASSGHDECQVLPGVETSDYKAAKEKVR